MILFDILQLTYNLQTQNCGIFQTSSSRPSKWVPTCLRGQRRRRRGWCRPPDPGQGTSWRSRSGYGHAGTHFEALDKLVRKMPLILGKRPVDFQNFNGLKSSDKKEKFLPALFWPLRVGWGLHAGRGIRVGRCLGAGRGGWPSGPCQLWPWPSSMNSKFDFRFQLPEVFQSGNGRRLREFL